MKKLLLALVLFFSTYYCSSAFGIALPSRFGSEFKLRAYSPEFEDIYNIRDAFYDGWMYELDILTTKLMADKIFISAIGTLGKDTSGIGGAAFYELSDTLSVGFNTRATGDFDFTNAAIILFSIESNCCFYEPFAAIEIKEKTASTFGLRFYLKERISLVAGIERVDEGYHLVLKAGAPIKSSFTDIAKIFNFDKKKESEDKK